MIDPTIAAAIVKESGGLIKELLKLAGKSDPTRQAKTTIDKTYDKLSSALTTNCVRVLLVLRKTGGKMSEGMILQEVEPLRQRQEPTNPHPFESDLKYRMHFLSLLGLVQQTANEWAITQLGVAFLAKAAGDTINYTPAFVA
jgi:hypothetical protein